MLPTEQQNEREPIVSQDSRLQCAERNGRQSCMRAAWEHLGGVPNPPGRSTGSQQAGFYTASLQARHDCEGRQ